MRETFEEIWSGAASLIGLAIFVVVMWMIAKSHARMWRRVSARYGERERFPSVATKLESIVVAQRGALKPFDANAQYRQYAGTILSVAKSGLRLSLVPIPPLNIMAPALFLPFDEMTLHRTNWALWSEPFAIGMKGLHDIDIILGRETVAWIRSRTDRPPFGSKI